MAFAFAVKLLALASATQGRNLLAKQEDEFDWENTEAARNPPEHVNNCLQATDCSTCRSACQETCEINCAHETSSCDDDACSSISTTVCRTRFPGECSNVE